MLVGAHESIAGGVANAVERQIKNGGNCGQIFTHSPQVWQDPSIDEADAEAFRDRSQTHDIGPWVIHSSYLVNLCTPKDDLRAKSIDSMQQEIDAAAQLSIPYVNVHLGAHTGAGEQQGLDNAVSALDELTIPDSVTVLLESDAGSGTKLGDKFDHLSYVLEESTHELEVCLDTAHLFAAGYDLSTPAAVHATMTEFDTTVGVDKLACIHLNDSKHACGTNKDEHAHIGKGKIGESGMEAFINHPAVDPVPLVLETPNENNRGFEWNINRVRDLADNPA